MFTMKKLTEKNVMNTLNMFCSTDEMRDWMKEPFIKDDIYAATDGIGMLYIDCDKIKLPINNMPKIDVKSILRNNLNFNITVNVFDLYEKILKVTPLVDEFKYPEHDCDDCDDGEVECDLGHIHDCEKCDGTGVVEGKTPTGKKIIDSSSYYMFKSRAVRYDQIIRVIEFTKMVGESTIQMSDDDILTSFYFEAGHYKLIVMACRQDEDYELINIED